MPASEFENYAVPLRDVWRQPAEELRQRLLEATSVREMFRAAEIVLLGQVARSLELHRAVRFSLWSCDATGGNTTTAELSRKVGLSERRYIEVFRTQVGLTPKAFCRVRRFQNVFRLIHPAGEVDWAQVALENGYCDQAHFIHDFREFSGLTPTQYWDRALCTRITCRCSSRSIFYNPSLPVAWQIERRRRQRCQSNQFLRATTAFSRIYIAGAAQAIEFYKKAFGAKERFRMNDKEGRVSHAEIEIGDSCIMMGDEHPPSDAFSPKRYGGSPIGLMLYV
jgi:AraC-like DNA-binding protein